MSNSGLHLVKTDDAAHEAAASVARSLRRVLLIEDDAAIRETLGEALQEEGFEVMVASNGREALKILGNGSRPSAILLDLMMPVMDGWDFRREQLNDPSLRDVPVLVVSATRFSPETIRLQFGAVGLIRKPVHYFELLEALDHACGPAPTAA